MGETLLYWGIRIGIWEYDPDPDPGKPKLTPKKGKKENVLCMFSEVIHDPDSATAWICIRIPVNPDSTQW
jgi:hypothetical protein